MSDLPASEHLLFQRIADGDEAAFGHLFNLFLPRLYPFIVKFTKSESAAQEVIQESFIRVWMNRDKLTEIDNPGGWLFKVASNECYNYIRKKVRKDALFTSMAPETESNTADISTQEGIDIKELTYLVGRAVDQLPAQRKKIYQMSRHEGKTIPEIAAELQVSPNTVKNTLVASLKFIRSELQRNGIIFFALDIFFFQ